MNNEKTFIIHIKPYGLKWIAIAIVICVIGFFIACTTVSQADPVHQSINQSLIQSISQAR